MVKSENINSFTLTHIRYYKIVIVRNFLLSNNENVRMSST
jgi:hypothetical protein